METNKQLNESFEVWLNKGLLHQEQKMFLMMCIPLRYRIKEYILNLFSKIFRKGAKNE